MDGQTEESGEQRLRLWYTRPAERWVEALPVGNGRLGAMVFGGTARARLQFNEDTLWTGGPRQYHHAGAADHLAEVRRLLFEGRQEEAERLGMRYMMGVPLRQMAYQPCGDLWLVFPGHERVGDYCRELDLDAAVASVRYRVGGTVFTRGDLPEPVRRAPAVPDRRQFRGGGGHRGDAAAEPRRRGPPAAGAAGGLADREREGAARPGGIRGGHRMAEGQAEGSCHPVWSGQDVQGPVRKEAD